MTYLDTWIFIYWIEGPAPFDARVRTHLDYERMFLAPNVTFVPLNAPVYERAANIRGVHAYASGKRYSAQDASPVATSPAIPTPVRVAAIRRVQDWCGQDWCDPGFFWPKEPWMAPGSIRRSDRRARKAPTLAWLGGEANLWPPLPGFPLRTVTSG
jgi:hypothetical protein